MDLHSETNKPLCDWKEMTLDDLSEDISSLFCWVADEVRV